MSAVPVIPQHVHKRDPWLRPAAGQLRAWLALAGGLVVAYVFAQHKASLKRLTEIPLTVTGAGFIDFAAFHVAHGLGWLVTGLSLVLIEHLIADADEG
jgi:hypothetical protein